MTRDSIKIDIAGGLYHELCELPYWRAIRGSGGRAAAMLAEQAVVRLHCYAGLGEARGLAELDALNIDVRAHSGAHGVAFAYFHSLSTPHIEPAAGKDPPAPPMSVNGEVVLRFGMIEGDAVVHAARRAVYDPQTVYNPAPFGFNGSSADSWALVVNAQELSAMGRSHDIDQAATTVFREQRPAVIIVKRGPAGASIFEADGMIAHVPAYRSARTFKIGTGDVFSAAFTLWWAGHEQSASLAADQASRAVAAYCDAPHLPIATVPGETYLPVPEWPPGPILLLGGTATMGQRYTLEEARFRLRELGEKINVACPALEDTGVENLSIAAMLVIGDGLPLHARNLARELAARGVNRVDLTQGESHLVSRTKGIVTDDFATALYQTIWSACENALSPF
ncbi:carbohydrate kinase family protein [Sphingopyxis terrae]|uniref:PfkB family carbohydrate kinase n=1 Tax=Sphingopyxis terrae subsp. ummariensis TaxID=429001 RepID=A0A1Y6FNE4_9SPHN|nr:carbohydrate kinase family protein [Sphingopyxis terrae]PCF91068.1 carbohydrate kinase family protein [Sphingopyxis terrae subsp. ummariensis]SMQ76299.1 pfkB family carbohydrate kinase [Sphingopyxis terrae subsp. ummariensis]